MRTPRTADPTTLRRRPTRMLLLLSLLAAIVALAAGEARADLIFLKDGFVLQGKVGREGKTAVDPYSGQGVWMPQGFYVMNDGARIIVFSPGQVQATEPRDYNPEHDIHAPRVSAGTFFLTSLRETVRAGAWDDKWDRAVVVRCTTPAGSREIPLTQHVTTLTPHYIRLDSLGHNYRWAAGYLTREFPPAMVRTLIASHPEFKEDPKMPAETAAAKRFRAFHFLVQAGLYDEADKQLEAIFAAFPAQMEKVKTAQDGLKKLRAARLVDDVHRAREAGQHDWVALCLADFPEEGLPDKAVAAIRNLKEKYEKTGEALRQARRFLAELPKEVADPVQRELFTAAARGVGGELDHDNVGRLEPFLSQAAQAERQKQRGDKPDHEPAELLALAVSGWLLGNTAADSKVDGAERLWTAREFVLKYQKTEDEGARQRLLREYSSLKNAIGWDEMAQLITKLPPPEPEEKIETRPIQLQTKVPGQRAVPYHLQLPPEYHHGRPHPVLIVLHPVGGVNAARDLLDRWSDLAAKHGYILAAPEWARGLASTYNYTAAEHAAVLDVLRDLRRRFQVDSDRVFLHGLGEGGSMAYDVALSHPDLFAGVVPMGGQPDRFSQRYRRNAQYLPFYVVSGDLSGPAHLENRRQFEDWVPKGYPAILVERRGRGHEFFDGELPYIFEWMKYKKRAMPMSEVGAQGREFQTLRATDNFFYWLSTDSIGPGNRNDGPKWNPAVLSAMLFAHVNRESNQITARVVGLRQLSIWLCRDSQGRSQVDFGAAVTVAINGQVKMSGRVAPSLETLLEDFYHRGDRQRLFLARIDFNKL